MYICQSHDAYKRSNNTKRCANDMMNYIHIHLYIKKKKNLPTLERGFLNYNTYIIYFWWYV